MPLQTQRALLWVTLTAALIASWLPYFDILNSPTFIGPLPLPLACVLASNAVLTGCAAALYPLYFKPLSQRLSEKQKMDRGL